MQVDKHTPQSYCSFFVLPLYLLPLAQENKGDNQIGNRMGERAKEDCTSSSIDGTRTFDTNYRVVYALETSCRLLHVDYLVDEEARAAARATGTCCTTYKMTQYVTFSQGLHVIYREKI